MSFLNLFLNFVVAVCVILKKKSNSKNEPEFTCQNNHTVALSEGNMKRSILVTNQNNDNDCITKKKTKF